MRKVLLLKQPQHGFHDPQRHPLLGHSTTPPISQTIISVCFIATAPTPHLSTTNADDLDGLPPPDPSCHRRQNHPPVPSSPAPRPRRYSATCHNRDMKP